jgi:demethylmenaquinone methyltransferase/2-methoxy-6-polyprenyl-1,4-benzoquinol methylase
MSAASPPAIVVAALRRASELDFPASCEEPVGPLLATLAAAMPPGGRILELGTGAGVGTAWLVSGLGDRTDASVTTVELDAALAGAVRASGWPVWVEVVTGDAEALLPDLGGFDLVFADAVAGKWTGLHLTLDALRPGGMLVLDDMDLARYSQPEHRAAVRRVAEQLAADPRLTAVRLETGTGITLATRHRECRGGRPSPPAESG